jgi:hypothetical protein
LVSFTPGCELFGFSRTQELSAQSAIAIADAARNFGQTDDITVLSIDFESEDAPGSRDRSNRFMAVKDRNTNPRSKA